jgi:thymidylate synthase (FAD)
MKVKLLTYTPEPIKTLYTSARTCYSEEAPDDIWEKDIPLEKMHALIDKVINAGHHSVLEHISFTFAIEGISRSCSHQLVRHRLASFSQQSQRYVIVDEESFVIPSTIMASDELLNKYKALITEIHKTYKFMLEQGIPAEDARFLLPNATTTNVVMTMNFRELWHASVLRLCYKAQWEIRDMFRLIRKEVDKVIPGFARYLQPTCITEGVCYEINPCQEMEHYLKRRNETTE